MNPALRALALAGTAAALLGSTLAAPAQAVSRVELQPDDLSRGSDIAVPHVEGDEFVDGERRIDVGADRAYLLGRAGKSFLLGTSNEAGSADLRIVRVKADDTVTVIKRGVPFFEMRLSENGRFLVHAGRGTQKAVSIRVYSAQTGKLKAEKSFASAPTVVAMDGTGVLLSSWSSGVRSWDIRTGAITRIAKRPANFVDVGNDLLATYTEDPYDGGCVVLGRLSSPSTRLWKSCRERIEAISPDGELMATVAILSDGIGPSEVWERETDGTLLGTYSTGWFGRIGFEDDSDLLLAVNGSSQAATVRCSEGDCENASDPVRVQQPRLGPDPSAAQNISVERRPLSRKPTRS